MSTAAASPGLTNVYPIPIRAGARKPLERDVTRVLGDVAGFDLSSGLLVVGGMPGHAASVEPVRLTPIGTPVPKAEKTKIHFMICFPPNYVCNFARSINPGLVLGSEESMHQGGKLPGMSSRVVEGTVFAGLAVVWPYLFAGDPPRFDQIQIRNWEVVTGNRSYVNRVNVGVQISV